MKTSACRTKSLGETLCRRGEQDLEPWSGGDGCRACWAAGGNARGRAVSPDRSRAGHHLSPAGGIAGGALCGAGLTLSLRARRALEGAGAQQQATRGSGAAACAGAGRHQRRVWGCRICRGARRWSVPLHCAACGQLSHPDSGDTGGHAPALGVGAAGLALLSALADREVEAVLDVNARRSPCTAA